MDEFLQDIYTSVFKQWILQQTSEEYHLALSEKDENIIIIETDYSHSEITFNPYNIIELSVTNTMSDTVEFYLHFQMLNLKHAVQLFSEMLDCIKKLVSRPKLKVLLSCSSGFTTGMFAEKLNQAAELLGLDFTFTAVAYSELFEVGQDFDVILLAPQISYAHARVQEILHKQLVLNIPPQTFAKYDATKVFELLEEEIKNYTKKKNMQSTPLDNKKSNLLSAKILCISLIRENCHFCIHYRLYQKGNILMENEVIKKNVDAKDLYDILNVVLSRHKDVKMTGITVPVSVNQREIKFLLEYLNNLDGIKQLSQKYKMKFMLSNDANCIALGYYASQEKYDSVSVLFQPILGHIGGVGSVYKGHLIEGHMNLAGEVQYLPFDFPKNFEEMAKTPEDNIRLASKALVSVTAILSPEVLLLYSQMIYDINALKAEMKKYLPEAYIPELIVLDSIREYILLGQMISCGKILLKEEKKELEAEKAKSA